MNLFDKHGKTSWRRFVLTRRKAIKAHDVELFKAANMAWYGVPDPDPFYRLAHKAASFSTIFRSSK